LNVAREIKDDVFPHGRREVGEEMMLTIVQVTAGAIDRIASGCEHARGAFGPVKCCFTKVFDEVVDGIEVSNVLGVWIDVFAVEDVLNFEQRRKVVASGCHDLDDCFLGAGGGVVDTEF
jgi:hypothetical protein